MGDPLLWLNNVIFELYDYLSELGGVYGNTGELQQDIRQLLRPVVDISVEKIRTAIRNRQRKPT